MPPTTTHLMGGHNKRKSPDVSAVALLLILDPRSVLPQNARDTPTGGARVFSIKNLDKNMYFAQGHSASAKGKRRMAVGSLGQVLGSEDIVQFDEL